MSIQKPSKWEWIWVGLALLLSLWAYTANLWANRGQVFEDSYITFRYAQHLAEGHGLVWNVGGPPTEGFTNLLLVVIVALFSPLQADPLLIVRVISIVSTLIVALLLARLAYSYFQLPLLMATLVACLWFTYLPTALHSVYGLETVLFTCLLVVLTWQTFRYQKHRHLSDLLLLLAIGTLLLLTRPEGIAYTGLALVWLVIQSNRQIRHLLIAGISYALIIGAWFGLRYLYFGYLLPNPFIIKTNGAGETLSGLIYVVYFIGDITLLLPWAITTLLQRHPYLRFCALVTFFSLLFYAFVRHEMGFHHRFLFPTFPFWLLMAGAGIMPLLKIGERLLKHPQTATISYGVLLFTALVFHPHELIEHEPLSERWSRLTFNTPYIPEGAVAINGEMGAVLASLELGENLVCLNEDAGVMPYISNCYHIGPIGLNNNVVARTTTAKAYADYLFGTQPDIIFMRSFDADWNIEREIACPFGSHGKLDDFSRAIIYADSRFRTYKVLGSVSDGWGFFFHIAIRNSSAYGSQLSNAFTDYIQQKEGLLHSPATTPTFTGTCPPAIPWEKECGDRRDS